MMAVFTCTHVGKYIPGCSVIVAADEKEASELLTVALINAGIKVPDYEFTFEQLDLEKPCAYVIFDGEY
jgi:hypothetical protein